MEEVGENDPEMAAYSQDDEHHGGPAQTLREHSQQGEKRDGERVEGGPMCETEERCGVARDICEKRGDAKRSDQGPIFARHPVRVACEGSGPPRAGAHDHREQTERGAHHEARAAFVPDGPERASSEKKGTGEANTTGETGDQANGEPGACEQGQCPRGREGGCRHVAHHHESETNVDGRQGEQSGCPRREKPIRDSDGRQVCQPHTEHRGQSRNDPELVWWYACLDRGHQEKGEAHGIATRVFPIADGNRRRFQRSEPIGHHRVIERVCPEEKIRPFRVGRTPQNHSAEREHGQQRGYPRQ